MCPPPPNRVVPPPQVLEKYGDIYGRERIAELLGMDLASLDIGAQGERKAPPDSSLLTWWVRGAHLEAGGGVIPILRIPLTSSRTHTTPFLQDHIHRHQVPDLEVWGHLHRQREWGGSGEVRVGGPG